MAHDVFISYSSRDAATASAVCAALEDGGIPCWIAPRDVPVGRPWKSSIVEAIRAARVVVLVFSGESNRSTQVRREIDIAFEARPAIPILPFRIEDTPMSDDLYYCIGASHWLDALTPPLAVHTQRLVDALRERGYTAAAESPSSAAASASAAAWATPTPAEGVPFAAPDATSGWEMPDAAPVATRARGPGGTAVAALAAVGVVLAGLVLWSGRLSVGAGRAPSATPATAQVTVPQPISPAVLTDSLAAPVHRSGVARAEARQDRPESDPSAPTARVTPRTARPKAAGVAVPTDPVDRVEGETTIPPRAATRAAPRAPDAQSVECARLLERESLGERLTGPEIVRREQYCRGTPK